MNNIGRKHKTFGVCSPAKERSFYNRTSPSWFFSSCHQEQCPELIPIRPLESQDSVGEKQVLLLTDGTAQVSASLASLPPCTGSWVAPPSLPVGDKAQMPSEPPSTRHCALEMACGHPLCCPMDSGYSYCPASDRSLTALLCMPDRHL